MKTKEIILIVLVIVLAALSYYLYSKAMTCKTIAEELGAALTALKQIPACAPYLP